MKYTHIQINIDPEIKRRLKQLALNEGKTVSELIRANISTLLLEAESRNELRIDTSYLSLEQMKKLLSYESDSNL